MAELKTQAPAAHTAPRTVRTWRALHALSMSPLRPEGVKGPNRFLVPGVTETTYATVTDDQMTDAERARFLELGAIEPLVYG